MVVPERVDGDGCRIGDAHDSVRGNDADLEPGAAVSVQLQPCGGALRSGSWRRELGEDSTGRVEERGAAREQRDRIAADADVAVEQEHRLPRAGDGDR